MFHRPSDELEFFHYNLFHLFKFISFDKQLERKQKRQQCENNIIKLVDFVVCDPGKIPKFMCSNPTCFYLSVSHRFCLILNFICLNLKVYLAFSLAFSFCLFLGKTNSCHKPEDYNPELYVIILFFKCYLLECVLRQNIICFHPQMF